MRRLEYRGYDSAGVAVVQNGAVEVRRSAGKLINLENAINGRPLAGVYGLGHTRWATHGRPTEENAHPHRDGSGRIVVVHNGIIENYLEIKRELTAEGHKFESETDTEVVAHLVEKEWKDDGLENAVFRAMQRVRGLFALVLLSADDPEKLVTVRNGPPIVVGIGDGEFFVASDVPAILSHTRNVVFLDDREMAIVTPKGVTFKTLDGKIVDRKPQRVTWDPISAEKAGYKHFMLKEIFEQPAAVRETVLGRASLETGQIHLNEMLISDADLKEIDKITLLACGTSWHAALVGKFMIEELAKIPAEVDYGSEYRYRNPIINHKTLAVAITQSGETADTLAAMREAKAKGARSLSICNVVGSMATREAEGTIYTHAGPEIGVASTKAFTTQLVALYLFALKLAEVRGTLTQSQRCEYISALMQLPQVLEATLKTTSKPMEEIAAKFYNRSDFLYLGRGINYPIALEGALKLKEISYIHAEGYPAGEMKHGPIALIDENMPVVALATHDHVFEKMQGNIQEAKARGGSIIAITTAGDTTLKELLHDGDSLVAVPATHRLLMPVVISLPLQLLSYYIAVRRGCDVDQPRNLAKSVTVE
ncbi:MAG TPA: glutamine--fructose-6-phosphate transaminase (isomerizing) [Vicinamibacterales bacterium]|nr:glutamine--fructose-6-phosphate transaminase (isomerizing) [Vicinamibacterales bacterium]